METEFFKWLQLLIVPVTISLAYILKKLSRVSEKCSNIEGKMSMLTKHIFQGGSKENDK